LRAATGAAQQHDPVGARHARAGALHHELHYLLAKPADDALVLVVLRGRIAFGHQQIAVRQRVEPARMLEPGSEGAHREAFRSCRHVLARALLHGRYVDGRQ